MNRSESIPIGNCCFKLPRKQTIVRKNSTGNSILKIIFKSDKRINMKNGMHISQDHRKQINREDDQLIYTAATRVSFP